MCHHWQDSFHSSSVFGCLVLLRFTLHKYTTTNGLLLWLLFMVLWLGSGIWSTTGWPCNTGPKAPKMTLGSLAALLLRSPAQGRLLRRQRSKIGSESGPEPGSKLFLSFAPGRKAPHLNPSINLQIGLQSSPQWLKRDQTLQLSLGQEFNYPVSFPLLWWLWIEGSPSAATEGSLSLIAVLRDKLPFESWFFFFFQMSYF